MKYSKKYKDLLIQILSIIILLVIIYLLFVTVLKFLMPFVLAYLIAYITNPVVNYLQKKFSLKRNIASAIVVLLTLFLVSSILFLAFYRIILEIKRLSDNLPILFDNLYYIVNDIMIKGTKLYSDLPKEVTQFVDSLLEGVTSGLTSFIKSFTQFTTRFAYDFAKSLPSIMLFFVVLFLSTYFISSDKRKLSKFIGNLIPYNIISKIITLKNSLIMALLGYLKAQLILMLITFIELSIGFFIIGIEYAVILALLVSIIDALPILGTGIILIPWAIFSIFTGDFTMGVYLILLYTIALLVRQSLEPKIISKQVGLYPLVTLMSIYIGLKVLGVLGVILGPVIVLVIKTILDSNLINIWRNKE
ncbi:sporulation integral membrane protein YtvI [Dethiothermospora halolimnae]|uniref:sporulation integral membrane protein YtvI n=1 Tax=Dethiothermospora halolimnae TaxID=3114390 RepID=UPI003CCBCC35